HRSWRERHERGRGKRQLGFRSTTAGNCQLRAGLKMHVLRDLKLVWPVGIHIKGSRDRVVAVRWNVRSLAIDPGQARAASRSRPRTVVAVVWVLETVPT